MGSPRHLLFLYFLFRLTGTILYQILTLSAALTLAVIRQLSAFPATRASASGETSIHNLVAFWTILAVTDIVGAAIFAVLANRASLTVRVVVLLAALAKTTLTIILIAVAALAL
jgi:hypothetical protein